MPSLLLGAGRDRTKKVSLASEEPTWALPLITVDMDPSCEPDLCYDLTQHPLPFSDGYFDEIGAYDVLEHWGQQGDWKAWFDEFTEYWRLLKPNGKMGILVPQNNDFLADPGHTRYIAAPWFNFLSQKKYEEAHTAGVCMTDYRWFYRANFDVLFMQMVQDHHLGVLLQKVDTDGNIA